MNYEKVISSCGEHEKNVFQRTIRNIKKTSIQWANYYYSTKLN